MIGYSWSKSDFRELLYNKYFAMVRGIPRKLNKGEKINKLTILGNIKYMKGAIFEECLCECGKIKRIRHKTLLAQKVKSCGCIKKETSRENALVLTKHGMRYTRFYKIYHQLHSRCTNKNNKDYNRYGGKGIKCLWDSFEEFKDDMYESYLEHINKYGEKNTTIDRINNNMGYCKENCRWATMREQGNNRSTNHTIEYKGKRYPSISMLCEDLGLNYHRIRKRINIGWDTLRAIETI